MSNAGYVLGSAPTELQRLIRQSQIISPVTERLLRETAVKQGMRVLDVGCGAGDVSLLAAEMVGASGSIIGIDRSPEAIAMAKERARHRGFQHDNEGESTVSFHHFSQSHSAAQPWFTVTTPFDLVSVLIFRLSLGSAWSHVADNAGARHPQSSRLFSGILAMRF